MTGSAIPAQTAAEVTRQLRDLAERLTTTDGEVQRAMAGSVTVFLDRIAARGSQAALEGIIALPFLVHGAETGDPDPGTPAAMAHVLWWVSARYLDDLSDAADVPPPAEANRGILAAIAVGCHLAAEILDEACPDAPERALRLRQELSRCWQNGIDGQLVDLIADPVSTTRDEVLAGYRGKTGAPYGMSAAMGAVLAGCDTARVNAWREFGERFGILRQIINDQRDLASGRHEDLRNGTATYLIVQYLSSLTGEQYDTALKHLAMSGDSAEARTELAARLTAPENLREYAHSLAPLIIGLHADIDALADEHEFAAGLHDLVDETSGMFPEFLLGMIR